MQQLVHRFQCFSFFFWFVWAVMQTELGTDWDSKGYAMSRWHLYKELEETVLWGRSPPHCFRVSVI